MYGHFRLDLEARRVGRKALGKAAREHAVAGEDVGEVAPEHRLIDAVEHLVSESVPLAACILGDVAARAHHHVRPVGDEGIDHARRCGGVVGPVAVRHDVDVRLDIGEHLAHHVALALPPAGDHRRARQSGLLRCVVRRVVVVHIDARAGQHLAEADHHRRDRQPLVVAGQQDGKAVAAGIRHRGAFSLW